MLKEKGLSTAVGDEGGFAPDGISSPAEAMKLLNEAIQRAGHADVVSIGSDPAASEFFQDGAYNFMFKASGKSSKSCSSPAPSPSK